MANNERIEQIKTFLKDTPNDPFLSYALATEYVSLGQDKCIEIISDASK